MNDPELLKCLNVQFSCTTGEDESMDVEIYVWGIEKCSSSAF